MDMSVITDFISKFGFPIACCCWLFYSSTKERDAHKEEMTQVRDALNNNTLVIQKLVDKLNES